MVLPDYYAILGLPFLAPEAEIKAAHRQLSKKYHPDLNPGNKAAEEKFKEIQGAYDVLISRIRRAVYLRQFAEQNANAGRHAHFGYPRAASPEPEEERQDTYNHQHQPTFTRQEYEVADSNSGKIIAEILWWAITAFNFFVLYKSCD